MEKKFKIGFIGSGFMASSMIRILIQSSFLTKTDVCVSDVNESAFAKISDLGVATTTENGYLVNNCEFVVFAVKPQSFSAVATSLNGNYPQKVISIMAGVNSKTISNALGGAKVARCMPNIPCSIGSGVVAVDASAFSLEDQNFIVNALSTFGTAVEVKEDLLDAVTGISGSGPAYVYLFIDALIQAGIKLGLSEETTRKLAVGTVKGGAAMMDVYTEKTAEELTNAVCSKGGTTIEAVNVFRADGLSDLVDKAVSACVKRAGELSKSC